MAGDQAQDPAMQSLRDDNYRQQPDNRDLAHIPGDDGYPLLGKVLSVFNDLLGLSREQHRRFGNVSRIGMGAQRGLMVLGADNWQRVLLDNEKNFSAEMGYTGQLGRFYEGGLLLNDFDIHRAQRRMMQGAFRNTALRTYVEVANPILRRNLQSWRELRAPMFFPLIKHALLEVGARIFIGIEEFDGKAAELNSAFQRLNAGLTAVIRLNVPGTSYYRGLSGKRALHRFFAAQIPLRRAGAGEDMFSLMCREKDEHGEYYPEIDIIRQSAFLLFAAHDTTTSLLCNLVMFIGRQSEWQQRLRERSVALGKAALDYEDLPEMEDMENCINEVLRLYPPVPLMVRRTIRETAIDGHRVPAHTMLFLPPVFNHRDAAWWSEPDGFDPDRFGPQRAEHKRHAFCFHPFGGGAHKCIGMHFAMMIAKCFMHQFLLRYRVETSPGYAPRMQWVPLTKPADGVPVTLRPL